MRTHNLGAVVNSWYNHRICIIAKVTLLDSMCIYPYTQNGGYKVHFLRLGTSYAIPDPYATVSYMYHDLNMYTAYIPSVVSWLSFATNRVRSASPLTCLLQQSGRREAKRWVGLSQSRDHASSHGLVIARTTARSWGMLSVPSMLPALSGSYSPYSIATGAQKRLPEPQSSPFSTASSIPFALRG